MGQEKSQRKKFKIPWHEWKHYKPKLMGGCESSAKMEICSCKHIKKKERFQIT